MPKVGVMALINLIYLTFNFYQNMFFYKNLLCATIETINEFSSTVVICMHIVR